MLPGYQANPSIAPTNPNGVQIYKNSYSAGGSATKIPNYKRKRLAEDQVDDTWKNRLMNLFTDIHEFVNYHYTKTIVVLLTIVWYVSAVAAITTSKMVMLNLPLPYSLCTCQFITASIITTIYNYFFPSSFNRKRSASKLASNPSDLDLESMEEREKVIDVLDNNINTNTNTSSNNVLVSGSSSGDVSSSSLSALPLTLPLSLSNSINPKYAVSRSKKKNLLLRLLLFTDKNEKNYSIILYLTAFAYTCGFLFTNMAFSIVTASFAETVKSGEPITSVILAYLILREVESIPTYMCLIPICIGVACSCIHDDSFNTFGFAYAAISNICFSGRAVYAKQIMQHFPNAIDEVSLFSYVSYIGLILLIPMAVFMEGDKIYNKFILGLDNSYIKNRKELLIIILCNGIAYTCYNTMSFLVLTRTNMVTHAILNCFRRVFIIIYTCYFFDIQLSNTNLAGVGIAVGGVMMFGYFKGRKY
jgi:drug/metabolite transporter (DMT)-like permease